MAFLDAALAFFISMLMLSLVGTLLVEMTVRRLNLRSKGLRTVLRRLYLDFARFHAAELGLQPGQADVEGERFAQAIFNYVSLAPLHTAPDVAEQAEMYQRHAPLQWVRKETLRRALGLNPDPAVEVASTAAQAAAAAPTSKSDPATEIAAGTAAAAAALAPPTPPPPQKVDIFSGEDLTLFEPAVKNAFVTYVVDNFEMRAENQGRVFAAQTRRMSLCYAFITAVALNVHATDIYQSLMKNAATRDQLVAAYEGRSFQEEAGQILAEQPEPGQLRRTLQQIEDTGLPLGWQGSSIARSIAAFRTGEVSARRFLGTLLFWAVNILASALLLGQGSPFWFDLIKHFMNMKQGASLYR